MFQLKKKPNIEEKPTMKDLVGDSGRVLMDVTKMNEAIKRCKEKEQTNQCRLELKELGIEFIN